MPRSTSISFHSLRKGPEELVHKAGPHRTRDPASFSSEKDEPLPSPPVPRKTHNSPHASDQGEGSIGSEILHIRIAWGAFKIFDAEAAPLFN